MAEDSIQIEETREVIQGQPQSQGRKPDDGKVRVNEVHVRTDRFVNDPNSDLAVQIPEGVGASTVEDEIPLATALRDGAPEDQFRASAQEAPKEQPKREQPKRD